MDFLDPALTDGVVAVTGKTGANGEDGFGDCGPGVPGTDINAAALNPMLFEIANAITGGGLALDPDDWTQLSQVIQGVAASGAPTGAVIAFHGAAIPAGWALCDGNNGTPNLRDMFLIGSGGALNPGDTGGAQAVNTNSAGGHSHQVNGSTSGHALTEAEMPQHSHGITCDPHDHNVIIGFSGGWDGFGTGGVQMSHVPQLNGNGPATSDAVVTATADDTGGGVAHSHGMNLGTQSSGAHAHTIADARPPFYAIRFIMKL